MANYRVLVDWDGDGHINRGVSTDTPPNEWPTPLYQTGSLVRGRIASTDLTPTDYTDVNDYGFITRQIKVGADGVSNFADNIRMGYTTRDKWQPEPGDIPNAIIGSSRFALTGTTWEPFVFTHDWQSLGVTIAADVDGDDDLVGSRVYRVVRGSSTTYGMNLGAYVKSNRYHKYGGSGYIAGTSEQYSNGMFVSGGSQTREYGPFYVAYTGSADRTFIARIKADYTTTIKIRLYRRDSSSDATTPYFGRTYIGGQDVVIGAGQVGQWQSVNIQWNNPFSDEYLMIDMQATSGSNGDSMAIGGLMILDGLVSTPSRFWDNGITYHREQFAAILAADTEYNFSFYVRSPNGVTDFDYIAKTRQIGANVEETEATSTVTAIGTDWQRVTVSLPSRAYQRGFSLDLTGFEKTGVSVGGGVWGSLEFTGYQLTAGATVWPYHAGTAYGYDDLTPWQLAVKTRSGKTEFDKPLPFEGTLDLELNNTAHLFSPSNEDSPLYGLLTQDKKVILEARENVYDDWVTLWSGWTFNFNIRPGSHDPKINLMAQQGIFRLREGLFAVAAQEATTMDKLAKTIIESSGWRSALSPYRSTVGYKTIVDENAYTIDPAFFYEEVQNGVNRLELAGQDWGSDTTPEDALSQVLLSENAQMWLNRQGQIRIVNRNHWIENVTPVDINIDIDIQDAEYVYGDYMVNKASVKMNRKKAQADGSIWKSHRAIKMSANGSTTIEINPQYLEGRSKTVINMEEATITKDVFKSDPGLVGADPTEASTEESGKVSAVLVPFGGSGVYRLKMTNKNPFMVWVAIEVKGEVVTTEDGETVVSVDDEAINLSEAIHNLDLSTSVLDAPEQAASMGEFYVTRRAYANGEFTSITINQDLATALELTIGSVISIYEQQTDEDGLQHVIIGEDFTIDPISGGFKVVYSLARGFTRSYYRVDISKVNEGAGVNLIEDMGNVQSFIGGKVTTLRWEQEGLETITKFETGPGQNQLFLSPGPNQIREFPAGDSLIAYSNSNSDGSGFGIKDATAIWEVGKWAGTRAMPQSYPTDSQWAKYMIGYTGGGAYNFAGFWRDYQGLSKLDVRDWTAYSIHTYNPFNVLDTFGNSSVSVNGDVYSQAVSEYMDDFGFLWQRIDFQTVLGNNPDYYNQWTGQGSTPMAVSLTYRHYFPWYIDGGISPHTVIQRSKVFHNMHDGDLSYKYTVYARVPSGSSPGSWRLNVRIYRGRNITIENTYSQTKTIGYDLVKFEVTIPANPYGSDQIQGVYAYMERVSTISREDTLYIYSYGMTRQSVSSPTDLLRSSNPTIVYP